MTSQINPNNIDGDYPVAGVDNNSQGFRDNFTNTKTNFQYAAAEITALQSRVPSIIITPSGGRTLSQNTSAQAVFDNPTNGSLTLTANTTYGFEAVYVVNNSASPSVAHSLSTIFAYTGILSSINYLADVSTSSGSPQSGSTNISRNYATAITALQVTPSATTTNTETIIINLKGILRTSTGGDFTPQIKYNTNAPGGTSTVAANSWFSATALGSGTMVSSGEWN